WAPAGHEVAWAQRGALAVPAAPDDTAAPVRDDRTIVLGAARIDAVTGALRLGDLDLGGPELVLWRAPTDNDRGHGLLPLRGHDREEFSEEQEWEAAELPRLTARLESVETRAHAVEVVTRVAPA